MRKEARLVRTAEQHEVARLDEVAAEVRRVLGGGVNTMFGDYACVLERRSQSGAHGGVFPRPIATRGIPSVARLEGEVQSMANAGLGERHHLLRERQYTTCSFPLHARINRLPPRIAIQLYRNPDHARSPCAFSWSPCLSVRSPPPPTPHDPHSTADASPIAHRHTGTPSPPLPSPPFRGRGTRIRLCKFSVTSVREHWRDQASRPVRPVSSPQLLPKTSEPTSKRTERQTKRSDASGPRMRSAQTIPLAAEMTCPHMR